MVSAAPPTIPTLRLGWSVIKSPSFKTREQMGLTGRLLSLIDQPYSKYRWTLTWEILRDSSDLQELRTLLSFYEGMHGKAGRFLYNDPTDNFVADQPLGVGDGVKVFFPTYRQLMPGGAAVPIQCAVCGTGGNFTTYLDGVAQSSGVSAVLSYTDLCYGINFSSAPGVGVAISAGFSYLWPCHFLDDSVDFENFAHHLFELKQLKFESLLEIVSESSTILTREANINFEYLDLPPTANNPIKRFTFDASATIPAGLARSVASSRVAAATTVIFDLKRNGGASFGTMTFASGATVATFASSLPQAFGFGDVLEIIPRTSDDPTTGLSGISGVIGVVS